MPRFQGIFTKVVCLENVRVSLPGIQLISGSQYPEINWFPGIVTRKSIYFWVTKPGNQLISAYRAPEIATKKTKFCEYLRENENIFENILACESRDQVLLIHEKNRGQKSHATVPLSADQVWWTHQNAWIVKTNS